jgi:DNA-binding response OmpR family regulator
MTLLLGGRLRSKSPWRRSNVPVECNAESACGGITHSPCKRIDLLVTDVGLPGLNGRQLADHARETRPDLRVLFITGYAENATRASGFLDPGMEMITKPFAVDALTTRIRAMIEGE